MPARSEFFEGSKMEKSISDLLVVSSIAALAVTCLRTDVVRTDGMLNVDSNCVVGSSRMCYG